MTLPNQMWYNWLRMMWKEGAWGSTIQECLSWEHIEWQPWKSATVDVTESARVRTVHCRHT